MNIGINMDEVKAKATKELQEEMFREQVEKYKAKLRDKKSFWNSIFPYKFIVIRKDKHV